MSAKGRQEINGIGEQEWGNCMNVEKGEEGNVMGKAIC
jgi:hypothetical protein